MQEKLMELQFLEQQSKQLEQQFNTVQSQIIELNALKDTLEGLSKVKKGTGIYVPLGSGLFIQADMSDNKELLMNVGTKTLIKKPYSESNKLIEKQVKELEHTLPQIEREMSKLQLKGQALQQEVQAAQENK